MIDQGIIDSQYRKTKIVSCWHNFQLHTGDMNSNSISPDTVRLSIITTEFRTIRLVTIFSLYKILSILCITNSKPHLATKM